MLFCLKRIDLLKSIANTQMADQFMLNYEGLRMAMRRGSSGYYAILPLINFEYIRSQTNLTI
jgi:hypothetical protein